MFESIADQVQRFTEGKLHRSLPAHRIWKNEGSSAGGFWTSLISLLWNSKIKMQNSKSSIIKDYKTIVLFLTISTFNLSSFFLLLW